MGLRNTYLSLILELKKLCSFPFLEIVISVTFFIILPLNFDGFFGATFGAYKRFGVLPCIFGLVVRECDLALKYQFGLSSLLVPLIVSMSIGRAISSGEAETMLVEPLSRFDFLAGRFLAILIFSYSILTFPIILITCLEVPALVTVINWYGILACSFINIVFVGSISLLISILIWRSWISSTLVSVFFWLIIRFMDEIGYLPFPLNYIFPSRLTTLLFDIILRLTVNKELLATTIFHYDKPFVDMPINFILTSSITIIVMALALSFVTFCKFIEFER